MNPKFIQITYNGVLAGYGFVNLDSTYEKTLRLNLSHFSTKLYDNYAEVLEKFLVFLQDNLIYDEILINLYYYLKVHIN